MRPFNRGGGGAQVSDLYHLTGFTPLTSGNGRTVQNNSWFNYGGYDNDIDLPSCGTVTCTNDCNPINVSSDVS